MAWLFQVTWSQIFLALGGMEFVWVEQANLPTHLSFKIFAIFSSGMHRALANCCCRSAIAAWLLWVRMLAQQRHRSCTPVALLAARQTPCASVHTHAMEPPCASICQSILAATCSSLRKNAGVAQVAPPPVHAIYISAITLICISLLMQN